MSEFRSLSVIIPAINETDSLREVVRIILATCNHKDLEEFFIVVCDKTTDECLDVIRDLSISGSEIPVRIHKQIRPMLGGAVHDAIEMVKAKHAVYVTADLDTDPAVVKNMINIAKRYPDATVAASRWLTGGGFIGYGHFSKLLNYLFQKWLQVFFFTDLTDITYGFRLFPVWAMLSITWDTHDFPFGVETYLKGLRLGYQFIEVPAVWRVRKQGDSQNSFLKKLKYIRTVLSVRFACKDSIKDQRYAEKVE